MLNLLFSLGLIIMNVLLAGEVTASYWSWFIRPIFPTLPQITYLQASGLNVTIAFMLSSLHIRLMWDHITHVGWYNEIKPTENGKRKLQDSENSTYRQLVSLLFIYPTALAFGYALHHFTK